MANTKILANYHTHTTFCDGANTAEEMVKRAIELSFTTLGFSSHMDPGEDVCIKDYDAYLKECYRLQEAYKDRLEILVGVELDNMMPKEAAEGTEYYIGSTHYFNIPGDELYAVDMSPDSFRKTCEDHFGGDFYKLAKNYYEFEAQVVDRLNPTFIGHFDLVTRFNDLYPMFDTTDARYRKPALEALEHLCKYGIPFEINSGAINRKRKNDFYPESFLLKALHDFGGEIIINSDAHGTEQLNGCFDEAVERAIVCGFTHTNILTKEGTGKVHFKQIALK
ncbi:MAG: histidinol-phosphatase [Clostridia bacterium]|nr:histidinol-phosphatase [Clostridia bacterium]